MKESASRLLGRLLSLRLEHGPGRGAEKLALLRPLARSALPTAKAVLRLHEALCFLRAYPDDEEVLAQAVRMLEAFGRRGDLGRHRGELEDSGVAGTRIRYTFFPETALWLAKRWPAHLHVDWPEFRKEATLFRYLQFLSLWAETPGLDEEPLSGRQWLALMKGPGEADGAYLARRLGALRVDGFVRQALTEELDLPMRLEPGPGTPSRTRAFLALGGHRTAFQKGPLARARPDLAAEMEVPPRVRAVAPALGRKLIDLAREAMITRSRDLDVFQYGDPRDVRLLDCGQGLCFAAIGVRPERRLLLEAVYAFLTLKNGVPIGYVLNSAIFGSAEIAYNVFETYRGAEAGPIYGRVLASVRHLFGVDAFTIYPYQLGDHNREALDSGAWWFYQKLGFRPREPEALRLMRAELARMKRDPAHRSSLATLRALARHNVYYHLGPPREDVIGEVRLSTVGLRVAESVGRRFGSAREEGEATCAREAAKRLGVRSWARWAPGERLAWRRWSPLLLLLSGVERWSPAQRAAAVRVVRAKGGRRESDFVRLLDAHRPLRREILRISESE